MQEVFLKPGEWYFGSGATQVRTVLGSCVAFVFWHPQRRLGGMTHSLLPTRPAHKSSATLSGHYADEALALLLAAIAGQGGGTRDYLIRLYGGGNMFPHIERVPSAHIGHQNAIAAQRLLAGHGLVCQECHVEGVGHRQLALDLRDGTILLRHRSPTA